MNKYIITLSISLLLSLFCWSSPHIVNVKGVPLQISDVKWVYLQFASDVKYADMGTSEIVVESTNVPSILRIKSNVPIFEKTCITVITFDGLVHSFDLQYHQNPDVIAYQVKNKEMIPINSYHIELSHTQTTHIIFPTKVIDIGSGHSNVIAECAESIDNIIKCKSITAGFPHYKETSLTIITHDKTIYPFIIRYNEYPSMVNIQMSESEQPTEAIFSSISINEPEMQTIGEEIIQKGCGLRNYGSIEGKMSFSLYNIYVKNDVMMFHLHIENLSKVDYEVDFIKSYIVNKKTTKKRSYQADEKNPLFTYSQPNHSLIKAKQQQSVVLFFKRFTIPNKHNLFFELFEKNGGRHLKFTIPYRLLLQASQLYQD
ncbi:MAG: conjugative transposon protein TraN [Bacteroidales bacterium]|nr:conjugative transposon protein TraN [Bacteroidales bacterium]